MKDRFLIAKILLSVLLAAAHAITPAEYFKEAHTTSIQLSPNGKKFVATEFQNGQQRLVLTYDNGKAIVLVDSAKQLAEDSLLSDVKWIDNRFIAVQYTETARGIKNLIDTQSKHYLIVIETPTDHRKKPKLYRVETKGWLVDAMPNVKNYFLYARNYASSKLYKINVKKLNKLGAKKNKLTRIDGGQFKAKNIVSTVSGIATRWFVDEKNQPIAAITYNDDKSFSLSKIQKGNDAQVLKTWKLGDYIDENNDYIANKKLLMPIAYAGEADTYYCLDYMETERRSLYKVNFTTQKEEKIYHSPNSKIKNIILDNREKKLVGVKILENGEYKDSYISSNPKRLVNRERRPGEFSQIVSRSLDDKKTIVYLEKNNQAGRFFIQDNHGKRRHIGSIYPHLDGKLKGSLVKGSLKNHGLEIPYLLELPQKSSNKAPLLVFPHGGPIGVFDNEYFNLPTQYFVANGFAVLRVNFRGSGGFSKKHQEAGQGEWGGKMLDDIHQAVLKVAKRSDIDENKVSVFGISYGGYAASMLAIKHPKTYKAAISMSAISDLNLMINNPQLRIRQREWIKEQVGDSQNEYNKIEAISPAYRLRALQVPLLIIHGEKDDIVDIEHAYRMRMMLNKHKKRFDFKIYKDLDHSLGDRDTQVSLFSTIDRFLKKSRVAPI